MWYYNKVKFKREFRSNKGLRREYLRIYHIESERYIASFPITGKKRTFGQAFRLAIKLLPTIQQELDREISASRL